MAFALSPRLASVASVACVAGFACVIGVASGCSSAPPPPPASTSVDAPAAAANDAPIVLSLIGTNDVHGHIESLPVLGGFLANLRAVRGDDGVLLVDAGDMFQGTLESNMAEGVPMVLGYNELRYDAVTLGNHEFDYGPAGPLSTPRSAADDPRGALKARARQASFPFLTANVVESATDQPLEFPNLRPTAMITKKGGIKIGLIGIATEETPLTTIAVNFAGLKVLPPAPVVKARAAELRRQGANLVVVLAHVGGKCLAYEQDDESCEHHEEIMRLADALPEGTVDAIVAGHTHDGMANRVHGIPIIESFLYGKDFGRLDFTFDGKTRALKKTTIFPPTPLNVDVTYLGRPVRRDEALAAQLTKFTDEARARKESLLGIDLSTTIPEDHQHESPLGNLFADLLRHSQPPGGVAQVGMMNGRGLRADFPAGPLRYGSLFESMPFDNRIAVLHLSGAQLRALVAANLDSTHGFSDWSGMRVLATCVGDKLNVKLEKDGGGLITDDERVDVVTSDFMAYGGDGVVIPPGSVQFGDETLRDAFERQLRALAGKAPLSAGALYDPGHRRVVYPGERPVTCKK